LRYNKRFKRTSTGEQATFSPAGKLQASNTAKNGSWGKRKPAFAFLLLQKLVMMYDLANTCRNSQQSNDSRALRSRPSGDRVATHPAIVSRELALEVGGHRAVTQGTQEQATVWAVPFGQAVSSRTPESRPFPAPPSAGSELPKLYIRS
jgi:hypothetical protein